MFCNVERLGEFSSLRCLVDLSSSYEQEEEPKEDYSHLPPNQQKKKLQEKIEALRASLAKHTAARSFTHHMCLMVSHWAMTLARGSSLTVTLRASVYARVVVVASVVLQLKGSVHKTL